MTDRCIIYSAIAEASRLSWSLDRAWKCVCIFLYRDDISLIN